MKRWRTDTDEFSDAVNEFENAFPGFWWSVGQCSVGAHASCGVDGNGCASGLLKGIKQGHPYDSGWHCDTRGGSPAEALRDVMRQAVTFINSEGKRMARKATKKAVKKPAKKAAVKSKKKKAA